MNVRAVAVALVLAVGCGGESSKQEGGRGNDAGEGNDTVGGARNGGASGANRGGTNSISGGTSGSGADGTGGKSATIIYIYDENNYRTRISLSIPTVETASKVDLEVCWSDVMSDLECGPVDPEQEIDTISMMRFRGVSEDGIEELLGSGALSQSSIDAYISYETGHEATCTQGSALSNFGTRIDFTEEYFADENLVYLFMFTRGTDLGAGSVTMAFARPSESSSNTELHAEPGCGMRKLEADLTTLEPVLVPYDAPWIIDWSRVMRDGQGSPLTLGNLDGATLWFVAGATSSDVADRITELDTFATERYHSTLTGARSLSVTDLVSSADHQRFSSLRREEDGIWLFGLTCSFCLNPSIPQILAVFEPVEEF